MIRISFFIISGFFLLLSGHCLAETVSMPLTVDYPLLRTLVVHQAFTEANETATILDEKDGCNRVTLSHPTFRKENLHIRFETRVHIRLGKPLGDNCLMPINWEGYLVFYQQPRIDSASWTLSFETIDSKVTDLKQRPANIAQTAFKVISTDVYAYLDSIRIDLSPPASELKSVFSQFFQPTVNKRSTKMVQSIRPGEAHVYAHAMEIDILMDVENYNAEAEDEKREHISDDKLERFIDQWEAWDAFLAHMIGVIAPEPLSTIERQILLDILLETRYQFIAGITNKNLANDFVREQFVSAWEKLAPIFRNHLADRPSEAILGYLAFFTACDALSVLDKIGPAFGLEISRNGLVRLVHLLAGDEGAGESDVLTYRTGVDIPLRDALGLGPPPPTWGPAFDAKEFDLDGRHESQMDIKSYVDLIGSFFCQPAWANSLMEIKKWLYSKDYIENHVDRTQSLLMESARDTLKKRKNSSAYSQFFPLVVVSTAWQESCFRQFVVKRKKIIYLKSYDGSSVGLMQINERVWRGIYELQHLRWDIRYNAVAGCEILDLYVTKYIAKHAKRFSAIQKLNSEIRAGLIYALYNGGPGQLDKYLSRSAKGKLYESDRLFLEKYAWVKNGQLANISKCLIGQ